MVPPQTRTEDEHLKQRRLRKSQEGDDSIRFKTQVKPFIHYEKLFGIKDTTHNKEEK